MNIEKTIAAIDKKLKEIPDDGGAVSDIKSVCDSLLDVIWILSEKISNIENPEK